MTCFATALSAQTHHPVLMISIDGLRPDYVTQADQRGLEVPNLRRILANGAHAEGVVNVSPTVTYPNHTTLVTGVLPSEHGIYNNELFDPEGKEMAAGTGMPRRFRLRRYGRRRRLRGWLREVCIGR